MRAIVLSGGGSKGAYQMGVWAALKKLNINYLREEIIKVLDLCFKLIVIIFKII